MIILKLKDINVDGYFPLEKKKSFTEKFHESALVSLPPPTEQQRGLLGKCKMQM